MLVSNKSKAIAAQAAETLNDNNYDVIYSIVNQTGADDADIKKVTQKLWEGLRLVMQLMGPYGFYWNLTEVNGVTIRVDIYVLMGNKFDERATRVLDTQFELKVQDNFRILLSSVDVDACCGSGHTHIAFANVDSVLTALVESLVFRYPYAKGVQQLIEDMDRFSY
jgi:hypothetical protein